MSSITNQVHILGNVGKAPEVKTTPSGKKTARFSVAAKEAYTNAEGKRVESTQWINVVAWENLAVVAEKYIQKGRQVAVCGRLTTRDYVDAQGEKKWITEVVATDILLLAKSKQVQDA